jgi:hypothetical protein
VNDADVMHLLKIMLKAHGKRGVPQGGVISPLLSNIYLTEVDRMLERAKEVTRYGKYTSIEYARFADDLVILIDAHPRHDWLMRGNCSPPGGYVDGTRDAPARVRRIASRAPMERRRAVSMTERMSA